MRRDRYQHPTALSRRQDAELTPERLLSHVAVLGEGFGDVRARIGQVVERVRLAAGEDAFVYVGRTSGNRFVEGAVTARLRDPVVSVEHPRVNGSRSEIDRPVYLAPEGQGSRDR